MASQDIIKSATLRAQMDPTGFASGASEVRTQAQATTETVDRMNVSMQKSNESVKLSAAGWDKFLGSIDPATRAGQEYIRTTDQLKRYQDAGLVSAGDFAAANAAITEKFYGLKEGAGEAESGLTMLAEGIESVRAVLAPFGVALTGIAAFEFGKHVAEDAAQLEIEAKVLSLTTTELQDYERSAKLAGVSTDTADNAIRRMLTTMGDAEQAAGKQRDTLVDLGLTAKDISEGGAIALQKMAAGLMNMKDPMRQAADGVAIFGRNFAEIKPVLEQWAQGTDVLNVKLRDMGLIMGEDLPKQAHEADVALGAAWDRLKISATPAVVEFTGALASLLEKLQQYPKTAADIANATRELQGIAEKRSANQMILGGSFAGGLFGAQGGLLGTPAPGAAAGGPGFNTKGADEVLAKQTALANVAGETAKQRQIDTDLIAYAAALMKDEGKTESQILTADQAILDIGNKDIVNKIKANAIRIADGKLEDETAKRMLQHAHDFDKFLQQQDQLTTAASETEAERTKEADTIKGAQELQKQNGVLETNLVQTYAKAVDYLSQRNSLEKVNTSELQKQEAALAGILDQQEQQLAINAMPRDQRAFASQVQSYQNKYGVDATNNAMPRMQDDFARANQQQADDDIANLKEQVDLAGMLPREREIEAAILQEIHATHGQITDDQKTQIANLISLKDETQDWADMIGGVESDFGNFFSEVVSTGKFDFKSLTQSILKDWGDLLAKMMEQWIESDIMGTSPGGGGGGSLGGLFGGPSYDVGPSFNYSSASVVGGSGGFFSGISDFFAGLAGGGAVDAGQTVMVGENGPEVFTPNVAGYVSPNDSSTNASGGVTVNQTIYAPGATSATVATIRNEAKKAILEAAPMLISAASQAVSSKLRNTGRGSL